MQMNLRSSSKVLGALVLATLAVSGCNNYNNNANGLTTPDAFVNKLVEMAKNGQISTFYKDSTVAKDQALQPGYFVIWDSYEQKYLAVNLSTYQYGTQEQAIGTFVSEDSHGDAGVFVAADGTDSHGNPLYVSSNGTIYSKDAGSKDVDLQREQLQDSQKLETAALISRNLQMSFESAIQVSELADRVNALSAQGKLTDADRLAITQSMVGIAGLTQQELNAALIAGNSGDMNTVNALFDKAAKNLGMPSSGLLKSAAGLSESIGN